MAPKVAVSKPQRQERRPRTRGGSTSRASSSRATSGSKRVRFSADSRGNPSTSQPTHARGSDREEEVNEEEQDAVRMFDLSSLPEVVEGRRVPKPKFHPRDLPSYYFGEEGKKFKFYTTMLGRPVHIPRKIDFEFLDKCHSDIRSMINFQGWSELMEYDAPIYRELVLIFYYNWNPFRYNSFVKGVEIQFGTVTHSPKEHLAEILGVPCLEDEVELNSTDIFNELSTGHVYLHTHKTMKTLHMTIEVRMLRKVLESMILPKLGTTDQVNITEAKVLYMIYNYKRVSLPKLLLSAFSYMPTRSDIIVPYGVWLTKVFAHFSVPTFGESMLTISSMRRDWVGETLLKRMHITEGEYRQEMDDKHHRDMEEEEEDSEEEEEEEGRNEEREATSQGEERETEAGDFRSSPEIRHESSSSQAPQPTPAYRPSSAYYQLASEVKILREEVGLIRQDQAHLRLQLDTLLSHFGLQCPTQPSSSAQPHPSPIPSADPPPDVPPSTEPTFTMEELTSPQPPTQGEQTQFDS